MKATIPPPYEGGGAGGGWIDIERPNPLFNLPLHKGEKFFHYLCHSSGKR